MFSRIYKSALGKTALTAGGLLGGAIIYLDFVRPPNPPQLNNSYKPLVKQRDPPPSREKLLEKLEKDDFDVVIIGGGAVGTGAAVDGITRGLNVCVLEKYDFASGTSSKSTKMAHGGVRYLEKAIFQLSKDQLDLVIEALNERGNIMRTAPHLAGILPIMIPVYKWWQVPYFFAGCKMYDWFAGHQNLKSSSLYSKETTEMIAPMIDSSNLKMSCIYHDGTFNDARMNSTLAVTAAEHGATVLNYVEVKQLLKENGKVVGVVAVDSETGKEYKVKSAAVINATGPWADKILEMDKDPQGLPPAEPQTPKMVVPSTGVHIVLPEIYGPKGVGLLDPSTSDGRVMFFLPWQGKVLCGTTDTPIKEVPSNPVATEEEVKDILEELQKYLVIPIKREDVLSVWSGVRPLCRDPASAPPEGAPQSTEGLVRNHLIHTSPSGLVTICGGKWTTYREMAEDTLNHVIKNTNFSKPVKDCQTKEIVLAGGEDYSKNYAARLIHEYSVPIKVAEHLSNNYGSRAPLVLEFYNQNDFNKLPVSLAGAQSFQASSIAANKENVLTYQSFDEPFTVAELLYAIKYEYARTPIDFLARRTRLAFLDAKEALIAVNGVVDIMKQELNWDDQTAESMRTRANTYIGKMV